MPNMDKTINLYFELQKELHNYFGYQEDWVVIPMVDQRGDYWFVDQKQDGSGKIVYSPEPFTKESLKSGAKIYSGSIYTQRFLKKWVYRGEHFTLVSTDTHCDGNKWLAIFSNELEQDDEELKMFYREFWV